MFFSQFGMKPNTGFSLNPKSLLFGSCLEKKQTTKNTLEDFLQKVYLAIASKMSKTLESCCYQKIGNSAILGFFSLN